MVVIINPSTVVAEKRVESTMDRCATLFEMANVPFADQMGAVTSLFEVLGQQFLGQTQPIRLMVQNHTVLHSHGRRIFAGQQGRPSWSAHWRRVVAIQINAIAENRIDIRRSYLIGSVQADVVKALVWKKSYFGT